MNTYFAVYCLLAFAAVKANPPAALSYVPITTIDKISNPSYKFNYAVNDPVTGDNKGQWEARHGDVVIGAYSLVEPDGNIRIVEYTADPIRGFNAVVKRTGPSIHSVALPVLKPVPPVITKPYIAPVIHETIAPIAPVASVPIAPIGPIAPVAPVYHGPIVHQPIVHGPILEPLFEKAPLLAPLPAYDFFPSYLPAPAPWVSISGTRYGSKGHIDHRWEAGPFPVEHGLTIKAKH